MTERKIGLLGATSIGVGAIVGGGILALAGVAFAVTGPSAIVAFAANGIIAFFTALSFAEMASKFSESGGTYNFAKKVLSVDAAFLVGWVVWFASIVAAVLYALGFAHFLLVLLTDLGQLLNWQLPLMLHGGLAKALVAALTTALLAISLIRSAAGGGQWVNLSKVVVFGILILGGVWALCRSDATDLSSKMQPFFATGAMGLFQAMGYTFIALQGFDLIAAVGGEVKDPQRNLPRSMLLSLGIALFIYIPLLFVLMTVGLPTGEKIAPSAAADPEGIVALAAKQYLGSLGYGLVIVAAVLSMYSALQANLFAASRIARAMAIDRNLPAWLGLLHSVRGTPTPAIIVTAVVTIVLLLLTPDVAAAGAASSLIFLVTFALAHWICILVRQRSMDRPPPFRTPLFPLVPVVGGVSCLVLAVFQGIAVPVAGLIAAVWLALGGVLFLTLFAKRARAMDATSTVYDPELVSLRGLNPLVLVPIANPAGAQSLVSLASTLVPSGIGSVLMLSVIESSTPWNSEDARSKSGEASRMLEEHLRAAASCGIQACSLTTVAASAMEEIVRVARVYRCQSLMVGFGEIEKDQRGSKVEWLLGALDREIVVLRAKSEWSLREARRVLVPVGGRGGHDVLLARLLSSLTRSNTREITFIRVLPVSASEKDRRRAQRDLRHRADDEVGRLAKVELVIDDDPIDVIADRAKQADLLVLGIQRMGRQRKLFGSFTRKIAAACSCPLIVLSRRG